MIGMKTGTMKAIATILILTTATIMSCSQEPEPENDFRERAELMLNYAADTYRVPKPTYSDPEKVYWPVAIARMTKYGDRDSLANAWIEMFREKSPFHFILVGMARLMPLFPDAPAMQKFGPDYLQHVMDRTDSYNAWTCEGTENHITMSRTSGYLFAEMMEAYPDLFPEAADRKADMKRWIQYFSKRMYEAGTGEFNASTYGVFNIIGFLNLYDFAKDPEVRDMARAVLDYYACEIALHYTQGMTGGPESRGMPQSVACRAETDYLGWLWFGDGPRPVDKAFFKDATYKPPLQCVHAATSSYRPPRASLALARKHFSNPIYHVNTKPAYLLNHPGYITHRQYSDPDFSLGSANYPYGAFGSSAYKNVTWKLISRTGYGPGNNPDMVTGGGMYYADQAGKMRNPWHQLVQHKNVLIQMNKMPADADQITDTIRLIYEEWSARWEKDFIKRFSAEDDKIVQVGNPVKFQEGGRTGEEGNGCYITIPPGADMVKKENMVFMMLDKTFIAVRALHGTPSIEDHAITSRAPAGTLSALILEALPARMFKSADAFYEDYLTSTSLTLCSTNQVYDYCYISYFKDTICFSYTDSGSFTEPIYDWGYGPERPSVIHTSPPYLQPDWPSGTGYGRIPIWTINGKKPEALKIGSVYQGPYFSLVNGVLHIEDESGQTWQVDYSGALPAYKAIVVE